MNLDGTLRAYGHMDTLRLRYIPETFKISKLEMELKRMTALAERTQLIGRTQKQKSTFEENSQTEINFLVEPSDRTGSNCKCLM